MKYVTKNKQFSLNRASSQPKRRSVPIQFTTTIRKTTQYSAPGFPQSCSIQDQQFRRNSDRRDTHIHRFIPPSDTDSRDKAYLLQQACYRFDNTIWCQGDSWNISPPLTAKQWRLWRHTHCECRACMSPTGNKLCIRTLKAEQMMLFQTDLSCRSVMENEKSCSMMSSFALNITRPAMWPFCSCALKLNIMS